MDARDRAEALSPSPEVDGMDRSLSSRWRAAHDNARPWTPPPTPTVVLVPHPDDEVLLFGGLIARQIDNGVDVTVIAITWQHRGPLTTTATRFLAWSPGGERRREPIAWVCRGVCGIDESTTPASTNASTGPRSRQEVRRRPLG